MEALTVTFHLTHRTPVEKRRGKEVGGEGQGEAAGPGSALECGVVVSR
jgi:hypothetical protein